MKTDWLLSLFGTLLIGSITAYLAKGRGRSPAIWFFIGMGLGIFGLAALLLLPAVTEENESTKKIKARDVGMSCISDDVVVSPIISQEDVWFYLDDKRVQQGPFSFDDLKKHWKEKQFFSTTYVWCQGMSEWKKVLAVDGLENKLDS